MDYDDDPDNQGDQSDVVRIVLNLAFVKQKWVEDIIAFDRFGVYWFDEDGEIDMKGFRDQDEAIKCFDDTEAPAVLYDKEDVLEKEDGTKCEKGTDAKINEIRFSPNKKHNKLVVTKHPTDLEGEEPWL